MLVRHKDITFVWLRSSIFVSSDQRKAQIFVKMSFYVPGLEHYHLLWRPSLCKVYWSVCRDILISEICNRHPNKLSQSNWPKDPYLVLDLSDFSYPTRRCQVSFLSHWSLCVFFLFFLFSWGILDNALNCSFHLWWTSQSFTWALYIFNYTNRFPFDNLTPIMKHTILHYFCSFILKKWETDVKTHIHSLQEGSWGILNVPFVIQLPIMLPMIM